jgi:hypothetical protein
MVKNGEFINLHNLNDVTAAYFYGPTEFVINKYFMGLTTILTAVKHNLNLKKTDIST